MFKIIPILMGVVISYAVALVMHLLGMTNPDGSASWISPQSHLQPG
mgnify:CR=1 FL=1